MIIVQTFKFNNFADWNAEIFKAVQSFLKEHETAPNIILTNAWTSQRLDGLVAVELFEKGVYDYLQIMGTFSCRLANLECCVEHELQKHEFQLVFDDKPEFLIPEEAIQSQRKFEQGYYYAA